MNIEIWGAVLNLKKKERRRWTILTVFVFAHIRKLQSILCLHDQNFERPH